MSPKNVKGNILLYTLTSILNSTRELSEFLKLKQEVSLARKFFTFSTCQLQKLFTPRFEVLRSDFSHRNIADKSHTETGIDQGQKCFSRMNVAARSKVLLEFGGRKTLDIKRNTVQ